MHLPRSFHEWASHRESLAQLEENPQWSDKQPTATLHHQGLFERTKAIPVPTQWVSVNVTMSRQGKSGAINNDFTVKIYRSGSKIADWNRHNEWFVTISDTYCICQPGIKRWRTPDISQLWRKVSALCSNEGILGPRSPPPPPGIGRGPDQQSVRLDQVASMCCSFTMSILGPVTGESSNL